MDFLNKVEQLVYWALGELANSDFEPLRLWLTEPALKVVLSYGRNLGFSAHIGNGNSCSLT